MLRQVQGWLASEAICTENLVAWLRMLPCRDEAGAARLLLGRALLYGAGVANAAHAQMHSLERKHQRGDGCG